jgi:hypothetical protein
MLPSPVPPRVAARGLVFVCVLSLALCVVSAQDAPGPAQPIQFSHRLHTEDVKMACADCHVSPEKFGDAVGIPDAPRCLECHAYSAKQTPTLGALNASVEKKQPIPWNRVFKLRDFVFFDHRYHLLNGVPCETCHGPIATEDVVSDRLKTTSMNFCQPCHVRNGAKSGCTTCHDPR